MHQIKGGGTLIIGRTAIPWLTVVVAIVVAIAIAAAVAVTVVAGCCYCCQDNKSLTVFDIS